MKNAGYKIAKAVKKGSSVIVGVSGGPDSVALLSLLYSLQYNLGIRLYVAHFNHNTRRSAQNDLQFVKNLSAKWHLPFYSETRKKQKRRKGSLEDLLRRDRYRFFFKLARKLNANALALAHTQDDLAETVLMRILRGSGLQGLRAILPEREEQGLKIIRPLLSVSKKEILGYLSENRLSYRIDPTNEQTDFLRNKVRLKLLPYLRKQFNPNITQTLSNISVTLATDYDYLRCEAEKILKKPWVKLSPNSCAMALRPYQALPKALKQMLLRVAIEQLTGDTTSLASQHLREIEELTAQRPAQSIVHLPKNIIVKKSVKTLVMSRRKA